MEKTISIEEAEARFESLLDEVVVGVEYLVTRDGRPVARIVPVHIGFGPYEPDTSEPGETQ
jgi:prevent-host-death family protein